MPKAQDFIADAAMYARRAARDTRHRTSDADGSSHAAAHQALANYHGKQADYHAAQSGGNHRQAHQAHSDASNEHANVSARWSQEGSGITHPSKLHDLSQNAHETSAIAHMWSGRAAKSARHPNDIE